MWTQRLNKNLWNIWKNNLYYMIDGRNEQLRAIDLNSKRYYSDGVLGKLS